MSQVDKDIESIFGSAQPQFEAQQTQTPTIEQDVTSIMGRPDIDYIITGMPDQGRVYMTPQGDFGAVSRSVGGMPSDELREIVRKTYGTTDPMQVRQMFQQRGAQPFGQFEAQQIQQRDPESVAPLREQAPDIGAQAESRFARDILEQVPESGLLSGQYLKGKLGVGSYTDELFNALDQDPVKRFKYEQLMKYYEKEFPERAIPMQIAGAIASVVLGGEALKKAGGMKGVNNTIKRFKDWYNSLPKLGQIGTEVSTVTAGSGIEGLIYGYGEGRGDERGENAMKRAMTNVAFTIPIATAFPIVRTIMDKPQLATQQTEAIAKEFGISLAAADLIRDAYNSGGSLEQMLKQIIQSGDQRMIAETNEAMLQILDATSSMSGKSAQIVQDEVKNRLGTQTQEYADLTNKYFGVEPTRAQTILDDINEEFGTKTANAYDKAWNDQLDWDSPQGIDLLDILSRIKPQTFQKAMDDANDLALSDRTIKKEFKPIRFKFNERTGRIELLDRPNLFQLDMLKRALDEIVEGSRDPISNKVKGATSRAAQNILKDLRPKLKEMSKNYKNALALGQGNIKTRNMINFGQKFFKDGTTVDEVIERLRSASASEITALRKTVRSQIQKVIDDVKPAVTTGTEQEVKGQMKILSTLLSGTNKNKLIELLGDKDAGQYIKKLTEYKKTFELQARTRLKSPTASRQAVDERIEAGAERGWFGQLWEANPVGAMKQLRELIAGNPTKELIQRKDEIYAELAGFLVGRKGKDADTALQYLEMVRNGEKLGKAQQSYLVNLFKGFLTPSTELFFGTMGSQLENVSP